MRLVPVVAALLLAALAITGTGCAAVSYRVPGTEVQRLVQVAPMERGAEVRAVPRAAPLSPSTAGLRPPPPPPPAGYAAVPPPPPPGVYATEPPPFAPPPVVVVEDEPAPVVVYGPTVRVHSGPVYVAPPAPARPARVAPTVVVTSGAGWRGTSAVPVMRGTPVATGGGWRGTPVAASTPRPTHATFTGHHGGGRGGGHRGGGGSGSAAAVAVGVVAVVGLVAALAVAADHADRVEKAKTYDGWIRVAPTHPIHLHYAGNLQRVIRLCDVQEPDTLGLQYAVIRAAEGSVEHLGPAARAPAPIAAAPPSPPPPLPPIPPPPSPPPPPVAPALAPPLN